MFVEKNFILFLFCFISFFRFFLLFFFLFCSYYAFAVASVRFHVFFHLFTGPERPFLSSRRGILYLVLRACARSHIPSALSSVPSSICPRKYDVCASLRIVMCRIALLKSPSVVVKCVYCVYIYLAWKLNTCQLWYRV